MIAYFVVTTVVARRPSFSFIGDAADVCGHRLRVAWFGCGTGCVGVGWAPLSARWAALAGEPDVGAASHRVVQGCFLFVVWCRVLARDSVVLAQSMGPAIIPLSCWEVGVGLVARCCWCCRCIGEECSLQGFFHAILKRLGEEGHAALDCFVCFREPGPFPYFHVKYSTFAKYLDKDKYVACVGYGVPTFSCQFSAQCPVVEDSFNVRIWVPRSCDVEEVAFEVAGSNSAVCGDHVRKNVCWGHIGELQEMVSQDGDVLARDGLK